VLNDTKQPKTAINSPQTAVNPIFMDKDNRTAINTTFAFSSADIPADTCLLDKYRILEPLSTASGEADLYLCEYNESYYVAKVYRRDVAIKPEVIDAIKNFSSPYIAQLFDTGTYNEKTFEIIPYYEKGSLQGKTFSFEQLREMVVPCINEALRQLHKNGVIHKDLKPSNIMLRDDNKGVAIIDFGISSVIHDGKTVILTQTGMTPEYSAPETFRGVFLEESDYYSVGITLYELFYGHTPYGKMSTEEIMQYMSVQRIPIPDDMPSQLKELISGLTYHDLTNRNDLTNPNRRWTYEEVAKWCEGILQIVPGMADGRASASRIPAYKFNGQSYTDTNVLMEALISDWFNGKKQLYRGLLSGFFMACDPEIAGFCLDAEETAKSGMSDDIAFWQLIYQISPDIKSFYWKEHKYQSLIELGTEMLSMLRRSDGSKVQLWNELIAGNLISSFMKIKHTSDKIIQGVEAIEASARLQTKNANNAALNYYLLAYLLSGKRDYVIGSQSFGSIDSLADYMNQLLSQSFDAFDAFCKKIIESGGKVDPQFEAWLSAIGKKNKIDEWRAAFN
jgi:serine/threonine protein kinase